jgi:ubiquinone/menaquinone biosynthesis C-methylase UbiE
MSEHDWHSAEYVKEWIAEHETRPKRGYEKQLREQHDAIVTAIPRGRDSPMEVLDLGAGWGRLALRLIEAFPRAHVTALDFSEPMLDEARRRLADFGARVQYVQRDLYQAGSIRELRRKYDAVVSRATLHHVAAERLAELYGEASAALKPGGVVVNVDWVRRCDAPLTRLSRRLARLSWNIEPTSFLGGVRARIESWSYRVDRNGQQPTSAGREGATLWEHLGMMERAGLETSWKPLRGCALMIGRKRTGGS